jgi:competence protein ComGC
MEPKLNSKLNSKIVNKKFLKLKSLTLVEALVSITIISLLTLIMVQIMLIFSKLNKRATYLSDSDIKTKEVGLKIERAIYNLKNNIYFSTQFLYVERVIYNDLNRISDDIYTTYETQKKPIAKIFINPTKINNKYYRKVIIHYYKKNSIDNSLTNVLYLPEETFWKIEETLYKNNKNYYTANHAFYNPSVNNLNSSYKISHVNRRLYQLQRFKIYFYFYAPDVNNRPFSIYKKDRNFLINEYKKKYFTKKSYFIIFDYLYY